MNQHALTTRRVRPLPDNQRDCTHPEHNPPMHQVFKPGMYEHVCPGCNKKTYFTVPGVKW